MNNPAKKIIIVLYVHLHSYGYSYLLNHDDYDTWNNKHNLSFKNKITAWVDLLTVIQDFQGNLC